MAKEGSDIDQYVRQNKDTLIRIIKYSDNQFVRALALKFLIRYGDEPSIDEIKHELEQVKERK